MDKVGGQQRVTARSLSLLALLLVILTLVWVLLLVLQQVSSPPVVDLDQAIATLASAGPRHRVVYVNAALLTAVTVAFFAGLKVRFAPGSPLLTAIADAFVPVYGLGNLSAYLSQLFVIPSLLRMYAEPQTQALARALLGMTIHTWPGSAIAFLNGLAYAALGVPSVVYGIMMARGSDLRLSGLLLAFSGILSFMAFVGQGLEIPALAALSLVSGGLFLVALVPMAARLRKTDNGAGQR